MDDSNDRVGSAARIVLLGVLLFFALGLALPGGVVYLTVVDEWAASSRGFYGIEGAVGWLFGVCAAAAVAVGLIIGGIVIRLLLWRHGPLASLVLSILSTGFIIATYLVFSDTNTSPDSIEVVLLRVFCLAMLVLVALPPFLHWAMAKPVPAPATPEPHP
jgi:hypothetical protein